MFKLTTDRLTPITKVARDLLEKGLTGKESDAYKKMASVKDCRYRLNVYRGHTPEKALGFELKSHQKPAKAINWVSLEELQKTLELQDYTFVRAFERFANA